MSQQLRAVAVLAEDPGPIPSTHVASHNHLYVTLLSGELMNSSDLCKHYMFMVHRYTCRKNIYAYKIIIQVKEISKTL